MALWPWLCKGQAASPVERRLQACPPWSPGWLSWAGVPLYARVKEQVGTRVEGFQPSFKGKIFMNVKKKFQGSQRRKMVFMASSGWASRSDSPWPGGRLLWKLGRWQLYPPRRFCGEIRKAGHSSWAPKSRIGDKINPVSAWKLLRRSNHRL